MTGPIHMHAKVLLMPCADLTPGMSRRAAPGGRIDQTDLPRVPTLSFLRPTTSPKENRQEDGRARRSVTSRPTLPMAGFTSSGRLKAPPLLPRLPSARCFSSERSQPGIRMRGLFSEAFPTSAADLRHAGTALMWNFPPCQKRRRVLEARRVRGRTSIRLSGAPLLETTSRHRLRCPGRKRCRTNCDSSLPEQP